MNPLTCWLSWYDGGGTLWVAIIVTAGAGDTCCIMGQLHIETGKDTGKKREKNMNSEQIILQQQPPGAAMIK